MPYSEGGRFRSHRIPKAAEISEALVARAVVEAIDAFAAPVVRAKVLELALRWARRPDIPESGDALADFVETSLYLAAKEVLGIVEARAIREELQPIVDALGQEVSEVRKSWPSMPVAELRDQDEDDDFPEIEAGELPLVHVARLTVPPRRERVTHPAPEATRLVLVSSLDAGAVQALGAALAGHAILEPVSDALAMLDGAGGQMASIVVIDCQRPSVRLETLLALAPELPPGVQVVLWGERPDLQETLRYLGSGMPDKWIRCGAGANAEDVAAVCRVLVD